MRFFLWVLFVQLFPLLSLGLFTTWYTALAELGMIAGLVLFWKREYWKHQGGFDDRLPAWRMDQAMDRYVEEVKRIRE